MSTINSADFLQDFLWVQLVLKAKYYTYKTTVPVDEKLNPVPVPLQFKPVKIEDTSD